MVLPRRKCTDTYMMRVWIATGASPIAASRCIYDHCHNGVGYHLADTLPNAARVHTNFLVALELSGGVYGLSHDTVGSKKQLGF